MVAALAVAVAPTSEADERFRVPTRRHPTRVRPGRSAQLCSSDDGEPRARPPPAADKRRRAHGAVVRVLQRGSATVHCAGGERPAIRFSTDPETGVASGWPEAAICVQDLDVQCVLQFTLINAAGCALHRRTNRVIHRQECFSFCRFSQRRRRQKRQKKFTTIASVSRPAAATPESGAAGRPISSETRERKNRRLGGRLSSAVSRRAFATAL